ALTRRNVRLCISTDWANQDVLLELRFLHELPMLVSGIRQLSPMELLRMATINGAYALGLSAETGSIEPGKSADLTFFNLSDIRVPFTAIRPTAEELAHLLVRSLTSRDISDVMIDGEFYVGRGEIMTMSEEDVVEGFRKTFDRFFPVSSRPLPSEPEELAAERPTGTRGKVLPFVPEQRVPAEGVEGFEEGFQIIQPPPGVFEIKNNSVNMQPPPAPPPPKAPGPKPELSKDVKRIFGEDEGF
ncbi:MAG: Amidohydrolase domain protein, partial [Bacteroidetes bacterium]|nr:Amidohydrolase domain protein [Bacteroidota bacterium]